MNQDTISPSKRQAREGHWIKTRTLTVWVLVVWAIFSLLVHWFAGSLNGMSFIGFPLGYYFAVQGSLFIFVVTIFVQNLMQDKIDADAGLTEEV